MAENVIETAAPSNAVILAWGEEQVAPKDWSGQVLQYQTEILEENGWQITERQRDIAHLSALEHLDDVASRHQPAPLLARTIRQITLSELRGIVGDPARFSRKDLLYRGALALAAAVIVVIFNLALWQPAATLFDGLESRMPGYDPATAEAIVEHLVVAVSVTGMACAGALWLLAVGLQIRSVLSAHKRQIRDRQARMAYTAAMWVSLWAFFSGLFVVFVAMDFLLTPK